MSVNQRVRSKDCYMKSGSHRDKLVDIILTFRTEEESGRKSRTNQVLDEVRNRMYRQRFHSLLEELGLEVEIVDRMEAEDGATSYVKVHGTWECIAREAEYHQIKLPIKESDLPPPKKSLLHILCDKVYKKWPHKNPYRHYQEDYESKTYFAAQFDRRHLEMFLNHDRPYLMLKPTQRTFLVLDVMRRITLPYIHRSKVREMLQHKLMEDEEEEGKVDVEAPDVEEMVNVHWLFRNGVYTALYPLHDCDHIPEDKANDSVKDLPKQKWPLRRWLYENWAKTRHAFRSQPLNEICDYFGMSVGMYFAWLGYYTRSLILPAIVGLMCFAYGIIKTVIVVEEETLNGDPLCKYVSTTPDATDLSEAPHNISRHHICRACPRSICPFEAEFDACNYQLMTGVFDNYFTAAYAIFISIWAMYFVESWQQKQAVMAVRWNVHQSILERVETVRPEYASKVTGKRCGRMAISMLVTAFFFFCVLCIIFSVVLYRIGVRALFISHVDGNVAFVTPTIVVAVSSAVLSAIGIVIMQTVWQTVARKLTNFECHRTDQEYNRSYILKVCIFQFFNYYGGVFYLGFIKGKSSPRPDMQKSYDIECPPGGCMGEVFIQLAVIVTGKQVLNNILEIGIPTIQNWLRRLKVCQRIENTRFKEHLSRWEKDNMLNAVSSDLDDFDDYLELVIQFGFVVLFAPAFPLAAVFALINNIFEIRQDGKRMLTLFRRPIPKATNGIGPWLGILRGLANLSVVTNAVLIAFTTHFIDNLVYEYTYKPLNVTKFEMQYNIFNTSLYHDRKLAFNELTKEHVDFCYYKSRFAMGEVARESQINPLVDRYLIFAIRLMYLLLCLIVMHIIHMGLQTIYEELPGREKAKLLRESHLVGEAYMRAEDKGKESDETETEKRERSNTNTTLRLSPRWDTPVALTPSPTTPTGDEEADAVTRRQQRRSTVGEILRRLGPLHV